MRPSVLETSDSRLGKLVGFFLLLIIGSYIFLSYWDYSKSFHQNPNEWQDFILGRATAPAQYRIGVVFPAHFLSRLSHGHLAMRHTISLLDLFFLTIGIAVVFSLLSRTQLYRKSLFTEKCVMQLTAVSLLLFYLSWTLWYHKPETIANFGSLAVAVGFTAGLFRTPKLLSALGLVLIAVYLGTIRADSGFAFNLGLLIVALLPEGRSLHLGRALQIGTAIIGLVAVIGTEAYIKYVLYPHNPFSDSLIQFGTNLISPINLFCVIFALAPYFLIVWLATKFWRNLEAWESILVIASCIEFVLFFVVARSDEVRLFIPYAMALIPTSAVLINRGLLNDNSVERKISQV